MRKTLLGLALLLAIVTTALAAGTRYKGWHIDSVTVPPLCIITISNGATPPVIVELEVSSEIRNLCAWQITDFIPSNDYIDITDGDGDGDVFPNEPGGDVFTGFLSK